MMSCKDAVKLMSQEQDRSLSLSERFGLRLHVLICRGCRATERHFTYLRTIAREIRTPKL